MQKVPEKNLESEQKWQETINYEIIHDEVS